MFEVIPLPEQIEPQSFLQTLLTKFEIDRDYRTQFEQDVLDAYKQYQAVAEQLADGDTRSNLYIPVTYRQGDTVRARLMKALFPGDPYVDFKPDVSKESDIQTMLDNEQRAKIPAALVNKQLVKNEIECVAWDFLTSVLFAKQGYLGVGWRKDTKKIKKFQHITRDLEDADGFKKYDPYTNEPITYTIKEFSESDNVTFDDNEVVNYDWFDVWPDSRAKNWQVKTWRHVWIREWLTKKQVMDKLAVLKQLNLGTVFDVSDEEWRGIINNSKTLEEGRQLRLNEIGIATQTQDTTDYDRDGRFEDLAMIEVLNLYDDYGCNYGMILGRYRLGYYGETIYQRHKMIPLIAMPYDPLPGEINGKAFANWLFHLQEEYNTNRNQRVDNRSLSINQQWGSSDEEFINSNPVNRPGAFHYLPQGQGSVWPMAVPDTTSGSIQEEEILRRDMEDTVGTPALVQGVNTPGQHTAYELNQQNTNASARFDVRVMVYQVILRRLYMLMDLNNQQFMTDNRLLQIADEEGIKKWREASPEDIWGEWDYVPSGASVDPFANKELRRQQLADAIKMAKDLGIQVNFEKMYLDYIKTFDFRNVEKYMLSPEEKAQAQQAMMQQQQEQVQQVQAQKQQEMQMQMSGKVMDLIGMLLKELVKTNPGIINQLMPMMQGGFNGQEPNGNIQPEGIGEIMQGMAGNPGAE